MNKSFSFEVKALADDTGTFVGYASVYSVKDLEGDIVVPGAFKDSLKRSQTIPVLWNHSADNVIGKTLSIREDDTGLLVEGELNLSVQKGKEAYALLKQGALKGLSIGVEIDKARQVNQHTRELQQLTLWEYSLTPFPMNQAAQVTSVKSNQPDELLSRIEALESRLSAFATPEPAAEKEPLLNTQEQQNDEADILAFIRGFRS